jgi:hypothetical protein
MIGDRRCILPPPHVKQALSPPTLTNPLVLPSEVTPTKTSLPNTTSSSPSHSLTSPLPTNRRSWARVLGLERKVKELDVEREKL